MKTNCIICGKNFNKIGSHKCCSKECSRINRNKREFKKRNNGQPNIKICIICNNKFSPRSTQKTCSKECSIINEKNVNKLYYNREDIKKKTTEYKKKENYKEYQKEYNSREKTKQKKRQYDTKITSRFNAGIIRAKKRKIEFLLTLEQYQEIVLQPCHYCNDLMGGKSKTGIGLDRIDNNKGYTVDNVLPCCPSCNYIRCDILTVEETEVAIKSILRLRKLMVLK